MTETAMKQPYEAPALTVVGTFEEVTQGTNVGSQTDAVMPAHTPVSQVPGFIATHLTS